jgi:hypothetical protein
MSFLSRRPSRSANRSSDAGPDAEYDDYDYAPDGYARGDEDDSWSANEYFSPEGIKGRWAGGRQPGDHPAGHGDSGQREPGYGAGRDRQDRARGAADDGDSFPGGGGAGGYETDDYATGAYATGAYDLADGTGDERGDRSGRKRKDRGERGGLLRLRRDKGEDIWPDDGVSDEDYWASVAADRPLPPTNSSLNAGPGPAPKADDPRLADEARPAAARTGGGDSRGPDPRGPDRRGPDPRGLDPRSAEPR